MTQDNWQDCSDWVPWSGYDWSCENKFRCRPTKKTTWQYREADSMKWHDEGTGPWPKANSKEWLFLHWQEINPAKPKTKTVVFEELEIIYAPKKYITVFVPKGFSVRYRYTGNARTEEVPE